jgi:hypothetical protein
MKSNIKSSMNLKPSDLRGEPHTIGEKNLTLRNALGVNA